ncbi:MAG: shikimate dehydrogenase [Candidatus Omnitrophota bacterium]
MKQIFGLIGNPVKHSLSPAMQMAAFRYYNIDAEYRLFELRAEELESFLLGKVAIKDTEGKEVNIKDMSGFNVTIPYKVKVREMLEREFPVSKDTKQRPEDLHYVLVSGAVNTVKRQGDILEYFNTDASGFLESLRDELKFDTKDKNVLLIGCGGAGRAVIAALAWWKNKEIRIKKIYVTDINKEAINSARSYFLNIQEHSKNLNFVDRLQFIRSKDISKIIMDIDLLVNASPVGMEDEDGSVIDKNLLHKNLYVYDIVYNRNGQTQLVKDAKEILGKDRVADGLSMLLYQGASSFEHWTGERAPIAIMREALEKEVNPVRKDETS